MGLNAKICAKLLSGNLCCKIVTSCVHPLHAWFLLIFFFYVAAPMQLSSFIAHSREPLGYGVEIAATCDGATFGNAY